MTQRRAVLSACLVVALAAAGPLVLSAGPEDAAQAAAESWLRLVDSGDYAGSWEQAARGFKAAVKQADWARAVAEARTPLGGLASRRVRSRELTEKAPATRSIGGNVYTVREGRFVVLQFDSAFANRASASETVVVMADADGAWRVSGYTVR